MAKHGGMKGGHQRRALTACGNVAAAEISNNGDAGKFRKQRRIVQLHAIAGCRLMADGLSVAADGRDLRRTYPGVDQQLTHRFGVTARQFVGQKRGGVNFIGLHRLQLQCLLANGCRIRQPDC